MIPSLAIYKASDQSWEIGFRCSSVCKVTQNAKAVNVTLSLYNKKHYHGLDFLVHHLGLLSPVTDIRKLISFRMSGRERNGQEQFEIDTAYAKQPEIN